MASGWSEEANECAICWDRPASAELVPCGHAHCCPECVARLRKCPVCRVALVLGQDGRPRTRFRISVRLRHSSRRSNESPVSGALARILARRRSGVVATSTGDAGVADMERAMWQVIQCGKSRRLSRAEDDYLAMAFAETCSGYDSYGICVLRDHCSLESVSPDGTRLELLVRLAAVTCHQHECALVRELALAAA